MARETRKKPLLSVNETIAENRRARFEYFVEETLECGIVLKGTELKSLRLGQCSLNEAYAGPKSGEIYLFNCNIPEYQAAGQHLQHSPKAPRKLMMHKKQVNHFMGAVQREGYTLVPLKLYFNDKGRAKLLLGLGKGKKTYDKRATEKKRDWNKQKSRIMKAKNS